MKIVVQDKSLGIDAINLRKVIRKEHKTELERAYACYVQVFDTVSRGTNYSFPTPSCHVYIHSVTGKTLEFGYIFDVNTMQWQRSY